MLDLLCKNYLMTQILSIQSAVAYGFAGNSMAVFPLRRLGIDVWPVYTVNFSNHTRYPTTHGFVVNTKDVLNIVQGVDERGALAKSAAVLAGYQGSSEIGEAILSAVALTKERNPKAIFCADPVMGDVGRGFFVAPGIPEFMRDRVVGAADIMTPNLFELEYLTSHTTNSLEEVIEAANELRMMGPEVVLVTSVVGEDLGQDAMRMLLVTSDGSWVVETPLLDRVFGGSGDLTAAVFLAYWLQNPEPGFVLSKTASVVYSLLKETVDAESEEILVVQGQENLVNPSYEFTATRISYD